MLDKGLIKRKDNDRNRALEELYKLVDGETFKRAQIDWVISNGKISLSEARAVIEYLIDEGLATCPEPGYLQITHAGIKKIEDAHRHREGQAIQSSTMQANPGQYQFHPEIEKVSGKMFRQGHFKSAALEAYIRVIEEVKARTQLPLDGDRLMNHAFGCTGQTPVIRFNDLQSEPDRDEQNGLMLLYKGIVGLRNTKAHSTRIFNDPNRGFEYLALASLLMRLLEVGQAGAQSPTG
jgi:uncharacterized protein (TIGR02391 family)